MRYKWMILVVLFLNGITLFAQNRLNGDYSADYKTFTCSDLNIIVKPFVNNRAAFMIKGANPTDWKTNRVGFIDTTGKIVIKPVYFNCSDFHDNLALVMDTAGNTAAINRKGQIIIPFAGQSIQYCTNGLYLLSRYSNAGDISFVDAANRVIVPFGKYCAWNVSWKPLYGYEVTEEGDDGGSGRPPVFAWNQELFYRLKFDKYLAVNAEPAKTGKWAVINREGQEVIPPEYNMIGPFIDGLAPFTINNKCGIMDTAGGQLIPPEYDNLELTSGGFIIAVQNKKSGVVAIKNNKLIIPFKYDRIRATAEGAFLVDTGTERPYDNYFNPGKRYSPVVTAKFGVITNKGRIIIPVENQTVLPFGTGYLVYKKYDSTAVFDSAGIQKTAYGSYGRFDYPVCALASNNGYLVYNKRKRDFIHYDLVDRLFYKEENKWGLLDSAGEEVTKAVYDWYWYLHNDKAAAVKQGNQYTVIDGEGREIAGPYDGLGRYGDLFIQVNKAGKYGLLNYDAGVIVPLKYDKITIDQPGGSANTIIVTLGGKQTYYSQNGKQTMPLKYDVVKTFRYGFGLVMNDKKWGLVDEKGVEIIPCQYDDIYPGFGNLIEVTRDKLFGLITPAGKVVIPPVCSSITQGALNRRTVYIISQNGKTGMVDAWGKQFLPFKYDYASALDPYSNTLGNMLLVKNNKLTGIADSTGKIIIPVVYDGVGQISGTPGPHYQLYLGGKQGVALPDGKVIIPPVYDQVIPVSGLSQQHFIIISDGKYGIADDNGKVILPCVYTNLSGISDRSAVAAKGGLFGVIDWKQHVIVPYKYESIQPATEGYIVRLKDKNGVLDLKGSLIIPIVYNYISGYMIKHTYFLTKDSKMGVADATGKIILPVIYDQLEPCGTENIVITKDKLYGMIDYKGKVIYTCKYTLINCADGKVVEIY